MNGKIAVILGNSSAGGVEMVVANYLRHLNFHGEIHVFLHEGGRLPFQDELEAKGYQFIHLPNYKRPFKYYAELSGWCKKNSYTIMHSHLGSMSFLPLLAAKNSRIPVRICHNHSTGHSGEGVKNILKYFLKFWSKKVATHCFACGKKSGEWLIGKQACDNGEITYLYNAIEHSAFGFDEDCRLIKRKELGITKEAFVLGHVGRFVYPKNHVFLLKIFNELLKIRPNAELLLIGDGPLQHKIIARAKTMGIEGHVHFLGVRKDMPELFSAMDAFALPSFYEGFPVVGIEAQANGLPSYFSDKVDPDIAFSGNAHLLPLSLRPRAWAEAILSGNRSAFQFPSEYDIKIQATRLEKMYFDLALKNSGLAQGF